MKLFTKNLATLPKKYFMGVEFFRLADLKSLDPNSYFTCLNVLQILLSDSDFKNCTPGFYINYITNTEDDNLNSLRLVYHSINPEKTQNVIKKFVAENSSKIGIFNSRASDRPSINQLPNTPDDEEYKFQSFLVVNTKVFLEVYKSFGIAPLQALIASYRHLCLQQRIPPEIVLEASFDKHSNYFNQLKKVSLDKQYWNDLVHSFHGKNFGLHFLVNMSAVQESSYDSRFFKNDWVLR